MSVDQWLEAAIADAERRGMPELKPLLQGLAASTTALRGADWNERADEGGAGGMAGTASGTTGATATTDVAKAPAR